MTPQTSDAKFINHANMDYLNDEEGGRWRGRRAGAIEGADSGTGIGDEGLAEKD